MPHEQLDFDSEKDEFYIAVKNLDGKETARKDLNAWGLTKSASGFVIVKRELPSLGTLETETIPELYRVDLTYTIDPKNKELFLKTETVELENHAKILKIFLKNVNNSQTQQVPIINNSGFEDLQITKSKGKLIDTKQAVELLKTGQCMGLYNSDLTRRFLI